MSPAEPLLWRWRPVRPLGQASEQMLQVAQKSPSMSGVLIQRRSTNRVLYWTGDKWSDDRRRAKVYQDATACPRTLPLGEPRRRSGDWSATGPAKYVGRPSRTWNETLGPMGNA